MIGFDEELYSYLMNELEKESFIIYTITGTNPSVYIGTSIVDDLLIVPVDIFNIKGLLECMKLESEEIQHYRDIIRWNSISKLLEKLIRNYKIRQIL
jgi:hypothetical protein